MPLYDNPYGSISPHSLGRISKLVSRQRERVQTTSEMRLSMAWAWKCLDDIFPKPPWILCRVPLLFWRESKRYRTTRTARMHLFEGPLPSSCCCRPQRASHTRLRLWLLYSTSTYSLYTNTAVQGMEVINSIVFGTRLDL